MSERSTADRPSPQEAALALEDTRRHQDEVLAGRKDPLAVELVSAVGLTAFCASFDFVGDSPIPLASAVVALVICVRLSKTRRGAALLGYETTGPRIRSMPVTYISVVLVTLFALIVAGEYAVTPVMAYLGDQVAYPHTVFGVFASVVAVPLVRLDRRLRIRLLRRIRARKQGV